MKALEPYVKYLRSIDENSIESLAGKTDSKSNDLRAFFSQMSGGLGGTGLPRLYWRKKGEVQQASKFDSPIERDQCGVVAVSLTVPFRGRDIEQVVGIFESVIREYGFEPSISFVCLRPRTLQFHIFISFDRLSVIDDQNSLKCAEALQTQFAKLGHYPHRVGISSMGLMQTLSQPYLNLLQDLKKVFDPNGIISPGRYVPARR